MYLLKFFHVLLPSFILAIWPVHLNLLDIIILTILGERCKLWNSSLCSLLYCRFSSPSGPNIRFRLLFSYTRSLHSPLNVLLPICEVKHRNTTCMNAVVRSEMSRQSISCIIYEDDRRRWSVACLKRSPPACGRVEALNSCSAMMQPSRKGVYSAPNSAAHHLVCACRILSHPYLYCSQISFTDVFMFYVQIFLLDRTYFSYSHSPPHSHSFENKI